MWGRKRLPVPAPVFPLPLLSPPRLKLPPPVPPPPCLLSPSLLIKISRLISLFSIGIRFLFFFSSFTGLVSLLAGNSILPKILGPVNFSTSIFSITAGKSSATGSSCATIFSSSSSFLLFLAFPFTGFSFADDFSITSSFFVLAVFLGRVEESIAERSIFLITFGFSISGAPAFITSSLFSLIAAGFTSAAVSSSFSFFTGFNDGFSSFLKLISSSSFFFFASACAPFGRST